MNSTIIFAVRTRLSGVPAGTLPCRIAPVCR